MRQRVARDTPSSLAPSPIPCRSGSSGSVSGGGWGGGSFPAVRHYAWEKAVQDYPVWDGKIVVIQGTDDDIVDWRYNLNFIQGKITDPEIYLIPKGKHQLLNERDSIKDKTFDLLFNSLSENIEQCNDAPRKSPE